MSARAAPIGARLSCDYDAIKGVANRAAAPLMKLHIPKLPKKLENLLEDDSEISEKSLLTQDILTTGTKVVATIGPACQDVDTICQMIKNGMSCARLDLTNGDVEFHARTIKNVMQASMKVQQMVAIMVDTAGPEIFVKSGDPETYENGWPKWGKATSVKMGQTVTITDLKTAKFSAQRWPVTYEHFAKQCKVGDHITVGRYLSTGMEGTSVTLEVTQIIDDHDVQCVAMNDAELNGLITLFIKGCSSFADLVLERDEETKSLPIMTARDLEILKVLSQIKYQGSDYIDFLSLSYCSNKEQIIEARQTLDTLGLSNAKILAKVESRKALSNFESILNAADGMIISRGNLGIDVDVEMFPMIQKALVQACNAAGKPVLTTRVVDSMTSSPRPTRAEATDISNAVIDGVDGIILGAETLRGLFPVLCVKTVLLCAKQAETIFDNNQHFNSVLKRTAFLSQLESMASSTVRVADKIQAALIVVVTGSGRTARFVAKYRPDVPVIALTVPRIRADASNRWHYSGRHQARQSMLVRGLYPMLAMGTTDEGGILEDCVERAALLGIARPSENIVILYNPPGSEVPVIKLVAMDKFGKRMDQRIQSMLDVTAASGRLGGSSGSESSLEGGQFP
ncbi:pyruvate kinase [Chloropicon primus]|uniref:pyruvate kinase n=1 Tax=Chloropicon primus TaxID=1764295 RepID=A0A5B8MH00_9CHLO|nr:pyruvate kinase [Chloropicon primus]UPQ98937.1 pyruvate kinase [Chloropicon primus]|eukprot:QDZ19726.1 pyruvate kinase [Chloropicon primus]